MDSEQVNDEKMIHSNNKGSTGIKQRVRERTRSQTSISSNTDINDPENLDYEEEEDKTNESVSKNLIEKMSSFEQNVENENDDKSKINEDEQSRDKSSNVSDEGELDEVDLEDGEIHDPNSGKSKNNNDENEQQETKTNGQSLNVPSSPANKGQCRFFLQGRCHWGSSCKYVHSKTETKPLNQEISPTNNISSNGSIPISVGGKTSWISPPVGTASTHFFSNSQIHGPTNVLSASSNVAESAWERGLRSAKTLREQSMRRKQQDKDFNEKKFNLSVRDASDEKPIELDSNRIDSERNESNSKTEAEKKDFSHRFHSSSNYSNVHRPNSLNRSTNSNHDQRLRHSNEFSNDRRRNEKSSTKNHVKNENSNSPYKRNFSQKQYSAGSFHDNVNSTHSHPGNRRADDWQDPWDRTRNYRSSKNRRGSGAARKPSFSSSSRSFSSSSRSSRSRSSSSSSSSRSRSRSKRRSSSTTKSNRLNDSSKNGNQKKSNDANKKSIQLSPPSAPNKFLPGRQISSHTLKKAEKSSNHSHSLNNSSKTASSRKSRKSRKSRLDQSDSSSSSSSSSDSETRRASSSSSDSSSSENETKPPSVSKNKTATSSKSISNDHSEKTVNRQTNSPSGGNLSATKNSKIDSSKKRRDTSSSTGSTSTSTKKKAKINVDSQKSPGEATNDSENKMKKQKLLQEIQEAENLINQRSTKT